MQIIKKRAYARAGLIGNPSDGYNGKTIAVSVCNFYAEVVLYEWHELEILPQPGDQARFTSIANLHDNIVHHGYYGGVRLIKATIKTFYDYCQQHKITLHTRNFSIRYLSTIPMQVGLGGSSAIITATLRTLMEFYEVPIAERVQPSLVLSVERDELGIEGGLQDRVIQVMEGAVVMDFSESAMETIDGFTCGRYQPLDPSSLPPLYLAWRQSSSEPTEVFHNDLRARYDANDAAVVGAMRAFADLTDTATQAIEIGDNTALAMSMDSNFNLRQSICVLNPRHVDMIEAARSVGASAKYAGSGGAIIGICDSDDVYAQLEHVLGALDCDIIRPAISPVSL